MWDLRSCTRDQIGIPRIGRQILNHWTTSMRACSVAQSCLTLRDPVQEPSRLLCPWDFPGKNTGVGCCFLLQELLCVILPKCQHMELFSNILITLPWEERCQRNCSFSKLKIWGFSCFSPHSKGHLLCFLLVLMITGLGLTESMCPRARTGIWLFFIFPFLFKLLGFWERPLLYISTYFH